MKKHFWRQMGVVLGGLVVVASVAGYWVAPKKGQAINRVYKAASVATIKGQDFLVVTNEQGLEILEISSNRLLKRGEANVTGSGSTTFGVTTTSTDRQTNAYVAAGANLLKFDITDPNWPVLEIVNNYFGQAYDVAPFGSNNIVVAGSNGVSLHETRKFDTVERFTTIPAYGITRTTRGQMVAALDNEAVVMDSRGQVIQRQNFTMSHYRLRQVYGDSQGNYYVPGDVKLVKIGSSQGWDNQSGQGYSVSGVDMEPYIYVANGATVVKLNKTDLKVVQTKNIRKKTPAAWATSVRTFVTPHGLRVAVLAGQYIYLLDGNLKTLDVYTYRAEADYGDALSVTVAQAKQPPSSAGWPLRVWTMQQEVIYQTIFTAYGSGFWPGEEITVEFGPHGAETDIFSRGVQPNSQNQISRAWADADGRVVADIFVPEFKRVDAKVKTTMNITFWGAKSQKRYSTTVVVKPVPVATPVPTPVTPVKTEDKTTVESKCEITRTKSTEKIISDGKTIEVEKIVETKNCSETTTRSVVK